MEETGSFADSIQAASRERDCVRSQRQPAQLYGNLVASQAKGGFDLISVSLNHSVGGMVVNVAVLGSDVDVVDEIAYLAWKE